MPLNETARPDDTSIDSITVDDIVVLWRSVLGLDYVGVDDDFFDLGGNSITAIRLLPIVEQRYGLQLDSGFVFDHPTPTEFAEGLRPTPGGGV